MHARTTYRDRRPGRRRPIFGLLVGCLALLMLWPASVPRSSPAVHVIVRKAAANAPVEQVVAQLGGRVTQELHIIQGFAADIPATAIARLRAAPGVRAVTVDAPVVETGTPAVSASNLANAYVRAIKADKVWTQTAGNYQGQGIGVAVVDSGINSNEDFRAGLLGNRIVASVAYNNGWNQTTTDGFGHGNHVAGIVGGDGSGSGGKFIGVAPMVNLINVKVSDDQGGGTALSSNVIAGLQWVNDNRDRYNIRVVNLSLNANTPVSYHADALCAAVEILWINKIVVVVSAGNQGQQGALYPPANDPFVITVGATDDRGTAALVDDTLTSFSAYGKTVDSVSKPDIVAPGRNIVSVMPNPLAWLALQHSSNKVSSLFYLNTYFRMSGTSMAAPMVAGTAALLLQSNPNLTPDQVKYRLMATAVKDPALWPAYDPARAGAGYLDAYAAVTGTSTESANTGLMASKLLTTGSQPLTWGSANWNSANWNSANWNSANWNSANWNSANWNSDFWEK